MNQVTKTFFDNGAQTIIKDDCIKAMKKMKSKSFDMVFADPPYNLQLKDKLNRPDGSKVQSVDDEWDKFKSFAEYDKFTTGWLTEAGRVLKDDGSLWVIGSYHNIYRLGKILQDLGWWILNDIVWVKSNPMPNFRGSRFCNAHETMLWCVKSESAKYCFNYHSLKQINEDKQMRSDWYFPICSGSERLVNEDNKRLHPTQKPESLMRRILLASSKVDDLVLDPFGGSGTTAVTAKQLKRRAVIIEAEKEYCEAAAKRIDSANVIDEDALKQKPDPKQAARVPFGSLVEGGFIKAGDYLTSKDSKLKARVMVDGSLSLGDKAGSIHSLASDLCGQSINGWHYWHTGNNKIPINELRNAVRASGI